MHAQAALRLHSGEQAQWHALCRRDQRSVLRTGLHKQDLIEGFTKRYGVHRLVYYEMYHTMPDAIRREKRLKKWNRAWKVRLLESMNPEWTDLFDEFWGAINEGPTDRARRHTGRDRVDM